ncbi:hypothetical protein NM688_g6786 [Phlebia brevispora]|uniref:Uncharacterized protein n=1 Tax=Phlebia brevispora TaxID=194682 RepID=A0ACC1SCJ2_9APHY|nr:hypothetical protein NM688_g6786 [Phlebia brevispora]
MRCRFAQYLGGLHLQLTQFAVPVAANAASSDFLPLKRLCQRRVFACAASVDRPSTSYQGDPIIQTPKTPEISTGGPASRYEENHPALPVFSSICAAVPETSSSEDNPPTSDSLSSLSDISDEAMTHDENPLPNFSSGFQLHGDTAATELDELEEDATTDAQRKDTHPPNAQRDDTHPPNLVVNKGTVLAGNTNAGALGEIPTTVVPHSAPASVIQQQQSKSLLSQEDRPYFTQDLVTRLEHLLMYKNESTSCYAIRELPINKLYWPPSKKNREDKSDLMHTNMRLAVVWLIGEIALTRFTKGDGNARRPCVLVKPLLKADLNCANLILRNQSQPVRVENDSEDSVWMAKWIASNSVPDTKVPPFLDVYDATDKMKRKAYLKRIDPLELKAGDLVLVEAIISRWPLQRGEEHLQFFRTRNWKNWRTEFRLDSIYVLHTRLPAEEDNRPGEDVEL